MTLYLKIIRFLYELEEAVLKEKKHCEVCLFYELIPDNEQGELFDNCVLPDSYQNLKNKTCENWVFFRDRTIIIRLLCEMRKIATNRLQNKKVREEIKKYKHRKEKGYVSAGCHLINGLLRAVKWGSKRGFSVEAYRKWFVDKR